MYEIFMCASFIVHCWHETDVGLPEDLLLYYSLRDELTYHAGHVVKVNRVIVPEALRETILQRLHGAHLGVSKMKVLAQGRVYCPKMHRSIEYIVLRWKACQEVGPRCNPIEPLQPHPIPWQPWSKLGSNMFLPQGEFYLIVINYYSNFPIIRNMVTSSKEVCVVLDSIISDYALPKEFVTDQVPCDIATEFGVFCQSRFVKHTLCTAFHHSRNRCMERAIQEVKNMLCKCKSQGSTLNLSLLQYRTTP